MINYIYISLYGVPKVSKNRTNMTQKKVSLFEKIMNEIKFWSPIAWASAQLKIGQLLSYSLELLFSFSLSGSCPVHTTGQVPSYNNFLIFAFWSFSSFFPRFWSSALNGFYFSPSISSHLHISPPTICPIINSSFFLFQLLINRSKTETREINPN